MATYSLPLLAVPAQTFSAQLGGNLVSINIQWMTRFSKFRVDISYVNGDVITAGRILNVGVNLLHPLYPRNSLGTLMLQGADPTPDNLGVDNELVWINE